MQFKNIILKRLNVSHLLMIIIFIMFTSLVFSINNKYPNDLVVSNNNLSDVEYKYIPEASVNEMFFTLPEITTNDIYLLLETTFYNKSTAKIEINGQELKPDYPFNFKVKENSGFTFYKLPIAFSKQEVLVTCNFPIEKRNHAKDTVTIGTLEKILVSYAVRSIIYVVFSSILLIMSVAILIMFYITNIESHRIVKFFCAVSLALSIHIIIDSPFSTLVLSSLYEYFSSYNIFSYFVASIFIMSMVYLVISSSFHKYIIKLFTAFTAVTLFISIIVAGTNYEVLELFLKNHNTVMNVFTIYAAILLAINLYVCKRKIDIIATVITIIFATTCTVLYNKRTDMSSSFPIMHVYFSLITLYIISVWFYIIVIFINRRVNMRKIESNLQAERTALSNLHLSGLNNLTYTSISWLCIKIGSQTLQILSSYKYCFIAHQPFDKKPKVYFSKGNNNYTPTEVRNIINDNFHPITPMTYQDNFDENRAYITFTTNNKESLYIYIDYKSDFTESEKIVTKILCSSILSTFNNSRVYNEISLNEHDMLLAIGNIINNRISNEGDCEFTGELVFILAKSYGMNENDANSLRLASYIHNIGTIGLVDELASTNNPNILISPEYMEHTVIGYEMLSKLDGLTMEMAAICSLEHHESYDGTGYRKMNKNETSHYSRIVAIATGFNVYFDNHKSDRSIFEVLSESFMYLSSNKQSKYDPYLVDLFIKQKNDILKIIEKFYN